MTVPVPAVLTLWSLGHSASDVARRLGVSRRSVSLIVEQARDIGDPRAVIHVGKTGLQIGRPADYVDPDVEAVPVVLSPRRKCRRGHALTKKNTILNVNGPQCRKCKNAVHRMHYQRNSERKKLYEKQRYRARLECAA